MLSILSKKSPKLVAVDISPLSVRLLELSKDGKVFHVDSYGIVPLYPNAMVESDIKDVKAVGEAIKQVVARSDTSCRHAIIAVPGSSVITKVIQQDGSLDEDELEAQVHLEASRYIPYPMNEVSLDFQLLGVNDKKPEKVDIFIAASRAQQVNNRVEALKMGHLTTRIVDVETYAIERACQLITESLPDAGVDKTIVVIDIGSVITGITVLHNLSTIYTREEVFGSQQLTEVMQHRYGLSYQQAILAKKQGLSADDYVPEVLDPFREAFIPLIRRSLQFFFSATHYSAVDHIVLAGEGAFIPGLTEWVIQRLGISCTIADPLVNMTFSPKVDKPMLLAHAPAFMVCCGLALRDFLK